MNIAVVSVIPDPQPETDEISNAASDSSVDVAREDDQKI